MSKSGSGFKNIDYYSSVAAGLIPGRSIMRAMGERINVGTTAAGEDIWRGNDLSSTPSLPGSTTSIPDPSPAGEQMTFISESGQDGPGGIGVRTLRMFYLDFSGAEKTHDLIMGGLSGIDTIPTNIRYVNDVCALTTGSNGVAVGNIRWYKKGSTALVYGMIAAGGNKSLVPHRMVPANKTLILKGWHAEEGKGQRINVRIRSTDDNGNLIPGVYCFKDTAFVNKSPVGELPLNIEIPSLSIVKVSGWAVLAAGDVGCSWWGELIEN